MAKGAGVGVIRGVLTGLVVAGAGFAVVSVVAPPPQVPGRAAPELAVGSPEPAPDLATAVEALPDAGLADAETAADEPIPEAVDDTAVPAADTPTDDADSESPAPAPSDDPIAGAEGATGSGVAQDAPAPPAEGIAPAVMPRAGERAADIAPSATPVPPAAPDAPDAAAAAASGSADAMAGAAQPVGGDLPPPEAPLAPEDAAPAALAAPADPPPAPVSPVASDLQVAAETAPPTPAELPRPAYVAPPAAQPAAPGASLAPAAGMAVPRPPSTPAPAAPAAVAEAEAAPVRPDDDDPARPAAALLDPDLPAVAEPAVPRPAPSITAPAAGPDLPGPVDLARLDAPPAEPAAEPPVALPLRPVAGKPDTLSADPPAPGPEGPRLEVAAAAAVPTAPAGERLEPPGPDAAPVPAETPPPAPDAAPDAEAPAQPAAEGRPQPGFAAAVPGVRQNRLPRIGAPEADAIADTDTAPDPQGAAPDSAPDTRPAVLRNAVPFENPETRPIMSIVVLDDGGDPTIRAALARLDFPVTIAIDPLHPEAAAAADHYRANGFEVVVLAAGLPGGATASDIEVSLAAWLRAVPGAVAVLDKPDGGVQGDRLLSQALVAALAEDGYGLITHERGLNPADQVARSAGLASGRVFRVLDAEDENPQTIRRYLDRAAFRAAQEGHVIVLGRSRGDTVAGLVAWRMEGRAGSVALAPVSAILAR